MAGANVAVYGKSLPVDRATPDFMIAFTLTFEFAIIPFENLFDLIGIARHLSGRTIRVTRRLVLSNVPRNGLTDRWVG
jgi:hypothetical protein